MTNADKYLKDEVNILELWENFSDYYYKNKSKESDVAKAFKLFFCEQATPVLTEDERVILRNIQKGLFREGFISRTVGNELFVFIKETGETIELYIFNHLFQFIKERRRI